MYAYYFYGLATDVPAKTIPIEILFYYYRHDTFSDPHRTCQIAQNWLGHQGPTGTRARRARRAWRPATARWAAAVGMQDQMNERDSLRGERTHHLDERDPPVLKEPASRLPASDHGCAARPEQTPAPAHAARRQPGPNRAAWAAAVGMQDKMNESQRWKTKGVVSE